MRKFLLFVSVIVFTSVSSAQPAFIKSVNAYTAEKKLGRKPVNLDGTETFVKPDSITLVFIETRGGMPSWTKAYMHNKQYDVIPTAITNATDIGLNKASNKRVVVKPKPGNRLWQLELVNFKSLNRSVNNSNSKIIIMGKNHKKPFEIKVKQIMLLELPDAS